MRRPVLIVALALSSLGAACGTRAFLRPAGPAQPAPDAGAAWTEATAACRPVTAYAASLDLSGRLGAQRIGRLAGATLDVAVTQAGQVGLEARASGQFIFRLGGTADRAVLVLEDRIVTAPASAIVEALIGLKISPAFLLAILTGCVSVSPTVERAGRFGDVIEIANADATAYLTRQAGSWRVRAGQSGGISFDLTKYDRGLPHEISLRSAAGDGPAVAVTLRVTRADANPSLPAGAFTVTEPPGSTPMTLDELRDAGPLGRDRQ